MTDWQTIDTAPKTDILLLWNGITLGTGYWLSFGRDEDGNAIGIDPEDQAECVDRWEWTGEGFPIEPEPTHWMPLPEPPELRRGE